MKYTLLLVLLAFTGCGSSKSTVPEETATIVDENDVQNIISNLENPINSLGYYGSDVYFGDQTIVGDWRLFYADAPWVDYFLNDDGSGVEAGLQLSYGHDIFYGVSEEGKQLFISVDAGTMDVGNIFTCNYFTDACCYLEDNTSESDKKLCKVEKNSDTPKNSLGHYGENVYFGDDLLVGEWFLWTTEGIEWVDPSTMYSFYADGSGYEASYYYARGSHINYGVSADATTLYISGFTYVLIDKIDGCYLLNTKDGIERLCKIDYDPTESPEPIERITVKSNENTDIVKKYRHEEYRHGYSSMSADGRFMAFDNIDTKTVDGETKFVTNIYVFDSQSNLVECVSVNNNGIQGDGDSYYPSMSSDGRFVAFESSAKNLVEGDTNEVTDIFVYDRHTDSIQRISVNNIGQEGNDESLVPSISEDGRFVAFYSASSNLVEDDTNEYQDIFVYDRHNRTVERIGVVNNREPNGASFYPSMSADGNSVAFFSIADNLVPGDTNEKYDIFIYSRFNNSVERVNVNNDGSQASNKPVAYTQFHDHIARIAISANGRYIAFDYYDSNLVEDDNNGVYDVFVYDRSSETIERVSVNASGVAGYYASTFPSISADGRYVSFCSSAGSLVANDNNFKSDVFVYDRESDTIERVSVNSSGAEGHTPSLSADGRFVTFNSLADNLVDNDVNDDWDFFIVDRHHSNYMPTVQEEVDEELNDVIERVVVRLQGSCFENENSMIESDEEYAEYIDSIDIAKNPYRTGFVEALNDAQIDFEKKNLVLHSIGFASLPNILEAGDPEVISNIITIPVFYSTPPEVYSGSETLCLAYSVDKNISEVIFDLQYKAWE